VLTVARQSEPSARTKTTGNFAKIEAARGKGAAINAYQNALKAHKAGK